MGVAAVERELGLELRWIPFPLHPEVPDEGMSLDALFGGRVDVGAMMARVRSVAEALGLPLGDRTHTFNTRRVQELGLWAEEQGRGDAFRAEAFRAYFAAGRNLADPAVLRDIAGAAGLDPGAADEVVRSGRYAGAREAAWAEARTRAVRAVPTHFLGRAVAEGFHPPHELLNWARGALAR
ncbi:MAG: DsbA family oxidoreductase [Candidatus Dadabacteria bacterium]|nr:MAG: DsbA family oxidoreductase [Candidatus Dadabacteria bacterium]